MLVSYDGMQAMAPRNNTSNHQRTRSIREGMMDECNARSLRPSCSFDTVDKVIMRLVLFLLEPQGMAWTSEALGLPASPMLLATADEVIE